MLNNPSKNVEMAAGPQIRGHTLSVHGVLVPFDRPEDRLIVTPNIRAAIEEGRFEDREARFLADIVRPGDSVLEIGAGIGVISTLVARLPAVRRTIAVEANPHLIPFMDRLHALNRIDTVDRVNAVFANDDRTEQVVYLREDFWMTSISPEPEAFVSTVTVPVFRLDPFLAQERIDLLICDIEGGEVDLLSRAELPHVDRILVEVHDHLTGLRGVRRMISALLDKGFGLDPRYSVNSVMLFRRIRENEELRPYSG